MDFYISRVMCRWMKNKKQASKDDDDEKGDVTCVCVCEHKQNS